MFSPTLYVMSSSANVTLSPCIVKLENSWGGSHFLVPYVSDLGPWSLSDTFQLPWAERSWTSLSTLFHHSPDTASSIASISILAKNYSIIRSYMWQWRYSSFYIFYYTRAIFSFFSTLIINLFYRKLAYQEFMN